MRVVRKITYDGSDKRVRQVVDHSLPDGVCPHGGNDIKITCETVEGAPPDPTVDKTMGGRFGDNRHVLGLNVYHGKIAVADLIEWVEARDAACAEHLASALRKFIETGDDVEE